MHRAKKLLLLAILSAPPMAIALMLLALAMSDGFGPGLTDFSADLGNGYQLVQSSAQVVQICPKNGWSDDRQIIPEKVVSCGANADFIIAEQNPLDAKGRPTTGDNPFWILKVAEKHSYGPFTGDEFKLKRKEFGVPDSLGFRRAQSYRP
ncbi:MAG TPA: DUF3997 domain-containing protein [Caulifigura sp.]|jgi:hypothetical protein|nr:DUF3997 domain-containing protein [Caulifigura sp.]